MPTRTKKTSLSIPIDVFNRAKARAEARGFRFSFSGYLTKLVDEDLERGAKEAGGDEQEKPRKTGTK